MLSSIHFNCNLIFSHLSVGAHDYQKEKMYLRNRQTRLNHHGSVKLVFGLLKCTSEHYSLHPSHTSLEIQQHLCKILGKREIVKKQSPWKQSPWYNSLTYMHVAALVKDNQNVCKEFASEKSLDTLVGLLNQPCLTDGESNLFNIIIYFACLQHAVFIILQQCWSSSTAFWRRVQRSSVRSQKNTSCHL